ncbi:hypothetical protein Ddye_029388, partial [Dipteronia dyeriana]
MLLAPRCNNELDTSKLKKEFPHLLSIKESLIKYVFEPKKKTPFGGCHCRAEWKRLSRS